MERHNNSNIVQNILAKVFTVLGTVFTALGILFFVLMNWIPAGSFSFFLVSIISLSVGVPFLIVGVSFFIYVTKKEQEKEYLITEGRRVIGKVIDYKVNYQVKLNRRYPVKLICESDEYAYDDANKRYISDNYWGDPEMVINSTVTIYVDRENSGHYYIDMRNL